MGDGKGRTEKRKNGKEDLEEVVDFVSLHKCLLVPLALRWDAKERLCYY